MKISVQQQSLKAMLAIISRAVPNKSVIDIVQNFHLSASNNKLAVTGTDLDISMIGSIPAVVERPGMITVPATLMTDIVNSLDDAVVNIESGTEPLGIHMECERALINIGGRDAELYPPIPDVEAVSTVKFTAPRLKKAIESVAFATSSETNRPALTGVLLEVSGRDFSLVAADGFRMSVYNGTLDEPAVDDISVLIPAFAIIEMARLLGHKEAGTTIELGVSEDERFMVLDIDILGRVVLTTQLIQGQFPDYRALIPHGLPTKVTVSTKSLLSATRTSNIMALRNGGSVTLRVSANDGAGEVTLKANANEYGDNEIGVPASISGPEANIVFNGRYLLDMINVVDEDELIFQMGEQLTPGLFEASGVDKFLHMIMPQAVQG